MQNVQAQALALNKILTARLLEAGWKVLSPLRDERARSAETLVATENPRRVATQLLRSGVIVTEKPEGIRVATHFFNNEEDIARLIEGLEDVRRY